MWRMPLRGGNWNNGSNAGLAALNLNNTRSNSNTNIGFRPALQLCRNIDPTGPMESTVEKELHSSLRGNILLSRAASMGTVRNVAREFYRMKTYNNLWEKIISWENLLSAYQEAQKGKRYRNQSLAFTEHLEENLITLQNELIWKTWTPSEYRHFIVTEPKPREISAPVFRDRVIHHALVRVVEPLFEQKFIHHSCACRKNRGTGFAIRETRRMVTRHAYVLKADITSYFPSINHDILKSIMRHTVRDRHVIWLIDKIIDSNGERTGIPIGALTSQLFANIYLDQLDHFVTDDLGYGQYLRYMDDFLIFSNDLDELKNLQSIIARYLSTTLALTLNHRTQIIPISHGVDFCGYRTFKTHVLPRKRNVKRAKIRLRKLAQKVETGLNLEIYKSTLMSFLGYMKHCNGYTTTCSVLEAAKIGGTK